MVVATRPGGRLRPLPLYSCQNPFLVGAMDLDRVTPSLEAFDLASDRPAVRWLEDLDMRLGREVALSSCSSIVEVPGACDEVKELRDSNAGGVGGIRFIPTPGTALGLPSGVRSS